MCRPCLPQWDAAGKRPSTRSAWTELNASLFHCFFPISFPDPSPQKSLAAAAAKCCVSAVLEEARLINLARDNQQAQWSRDRYNKAESNHHGVL